MLGRELQISDPAADLAVLRVAGGVPERAGCVVLKGDQGGYPTGAALAQVFLTSSR